VADPRGDAGVEYGLAAPPSDDVSAMFDRLTDAYDVTTDHFCSGAIPVGPPERVTTDRAFLIGDAARADEAVHRRGSSTG